MQIFWQSFLSPMEQIFVNDRPGNYLAWKLKKRALRFLLLVEKVALKVTRLRDLQIDEGCIDSQSFHLGTVSLRRLFTLPLACEISFSRKLAALYMGVPLVNLHDVGDRFDLLVHENWTKHYPCHPLHF